MPVRFGVKSEKVLLPVKIRPFLSHKRQNAQAVARLKAALRLYGAGGWKDTDDLRMGASTETEIRHAIFEQTGGFIWWGTRRALESKIINGLEIPTALERADAESLYPLVPIFVDLSPGKDRDEIVRAVGEGADGLLDRAGLVRGKAERADVLRRRLAKRYLRDAVRSLAQGPVSVAFRALSEPSGEHDLTFDWRAVLDERSRRLEAGSMPLLLDAVGNAREAFQAREGSPELALDLDLPLPLAFLVGFEWRVTTRIRLSVLQRTGASSAWMGADGPLAPVPPPTRKRYNRAGPAVVAVSCKDPLKEVAARYADEVRASELITIHVPGLLDDRRTRALARATANELRVLNDRGTEKHLLIRGPVALAMMTGSASNACGPVTLPFWDGTGYASHVVVGG